MPAGKYRRKCQKCRTEFRASSKYQALCSSCRKKSKAERTAKFYHSGLSPEVYTRGHGGK